MVIEQGKVVRSHVQILVDDGQERCAVDDGRIWGGVEDSTIGLDDGTSVVAENLEWGVGHVELTDESDKEILCVVDKTTDRGVVRVVVRHSLTWRLPRELDCVSWLRESSSVVGDGSIVAVNEETWLVGDAEQGEDGPLDPWVLGRTLDDVSRKQCPGHRLGDTGLEVDWHRVGTGELSEDHLLSGLGGDTLGEQGSGRSGVEVGEETIDTGFTPRRSQHTPRRYEHSCDSPSSEPLTEVDKVSNSLKVILVSALKRSLFTTVFDNVGEQLGVTDLLIGHEVDQRNVVWSHTGLGKLLLGESGDTVVEQVELDPFLVEGDDERLIVKVGHGGVDGWSVVGSDTDTTIRDGSWSSRDIGHWHSEESHDGGEDL